MPKANPDDILLAELAGGPMPVGMRRPGASKEEVARRKALPEGVKKVPWERHKGNLGPEATFKRREEFLKGPWQELLLAVSKGQPAIHAMEALNIDRGTVASITEAIPEAKKAWDEAQRYMWRIRWPMHLVEEIMTEIASGEVISEVVKKRGMPVHEFYHLALKDPEIRQLYDDAQAIRLESMAEKVIEVSDDAEHDFNEYGRLNSENINRARLRVDTRKWIMSRIGWKRFGDRLQTEQNVNLVVDHASRLDAARKRVEGMRTVEGVVEADTTDLSVVSEQ